MTTDYLNSIKKFILGAQQYANRNIKTSDGHYAYVTRTGVARKYADETVFNSTAGLNNCPAGYTDMEATWDDLGFPVGSQMAVGEACGREGQFVTAKVPKNNFDAKFYTDFYGISGLTTEDEALNHWNTQGKASGYLPNASILDSMAALGKIGYVDLNTTLHAVTNPQFGGEYRQYRQHSNVTGANMADCTPSEPAVKYGDKIYLTYNGKFGRIKNGFKFGDVKDALFIRPPVNSPAVDKTPVKYGDAVVLSSSISNNNDNACGYYGCQTAFVNVSSLKLEFGPGGQSGGTALQILPKEGGMQTVGEDVKLGDAFGLSAAVTMNSTAGMKQGRPLKSGKTIKSTNGQYVLVYQSDGNLAVYATATSAVIWQSNANIPHTPGKVLLSADGRLVEYDADGQPNWSAPAATGVPPYKLSIENNGKLSLLDKNATVLWSTPADPTNVPTVNEEVWFASVKDDMLAFDQAASDVVFQFQPLQNAASKTCDLASLKQACNANSECVGFVQSPENNSWQIIDKASHFSIAPTLQDFYLKEMAVPPMDGCVSSPPKYIEPQIYMAYGGGSDYSSESCAKTNVDPLVQQQSAMLQQNQERLQNIPKKKDLAALNAEMSKNDKITSAKIKEYKKTLQKKEGFGTMEQQKIDAEILQNQNKINAMFWTASALVLLLSVAFMKSKQ